MVTANSTLSDLFLFSRKAAKNACVKSYNLCALARSVRSYFKCDKLENETIKVNLIGQLF